MKTQFTWLQVITAYREARPSRHGEELRWILNRETIRNHPGICVIVPRFDDGRILLMHQYRYPIGEAIWELPAGTLGGREENGRMIATESAEECAVRELEEETGYHAARIEKLGECYAMPGSSDELIHLFLASDLTLVGQTLDIGEVIDELRPFTLDEIREMIRGGKIRDAKTLVGLMLLGVSV